MVPVPIHMKSVTFSITTGPTDESQDKQREICEIILQSARLCMKQVTYAWAVKPVSTTGNVALCNGKEMQNGILNTSFPVIYLKEA